MHCLRVSWLAAGIWCGTLALTSNVTEAEAHSYPPVEFKSLLVLPSGEVLAAGKFTSYLGSPCTNLLRLDPEGNLDRGFVPDITGLQSGITALAVQVDGKILAGSSNAALSRLSLVRMNPDGSRDTNFSPAYTGVISGLNVQPDGRILVAGRIILARGVSPVHLVRLLPDGAADPEFSPTTLEGTATLAAILRLRDGRILLGGHFTAVNGTALRSLARLKPDGSVDAGFTSAASGAVRSLAVQADGKIIAGGSFTFGGETLCRLEADGARDPSFAPRLIYSPNCLALHEDGRVVAGGMTVAYGATSTTFRVAQFFQDGTLDSAFMPIWFETVTALAIRPGGSVLVGGTVRFANGAYDLYVCEMTGSDSEASGLGFDGTTLTQLRSEAGPVVESVLFQFSHDGNVWRDLGEGQWLNGLWQLPAVSLSEAGRLRAVGLSASGAVARIQEVQLAEAAPSGFLEPVPRTNCVGTRVLLRAWALSLAPVAYQWNKDGVDLLGETNGVLSLQKVRPEDAGDYSVRVQNKFGALTLGPVRLDVAGEISLTPAPVPVNPWSSMRFFVSGPPGRSFVLESSEDLVHWSPATTNMLFKAGRVSVNDPQSKKVDRRFYRLKVNL